MKLHVEKFHARFSAVGYMWLIELDDIEFEVRNLIVRDVKDLKTFIQELSIADLEIEWIGDTLIVTEWKEIKYLSANEWYNIDMPKGLAKTVTVR